MRPTLLALEDRTLLSTFTVNNTTDTPGAGATDLRRRSAWRIRAGGANTITFDSTVFNTPQTITLGGTQLELSDTTGTETITGPAAGVTVSGGGASRVFQVDAGVTASISGLTITGGNDHRQRRRPGQRRHDHADQLHRQRQLRRRLLGGGGLYNGGTLTLTNCTVSGNSANWLRRRRGSTRRRYFGNCAAAPRSTLTNCTVSGNSGQLRGGLSAGRPGHADQHDRRRQHGEATSTPRPLSGTNNLIGTGGCGRAGERGQRQPRRRGQPGAGPAGQLRRPDPDDGPAARQPGDRRRHQRPRHPHDRPARPGPGSAPSTSAPSRARASPSRSVAGSTPQTANIGTAFANPLAVTVTANNPVEPVNGGVVTFVANPASQWRLGDLLAGLLGRHRQRPGRRHRRAQQHGRQSYQVVGVGLGLVTGLLRSHQHRPGLHSA